MNCRCSWSRISWRNKRCPSGKGEKGSRIPLSCPDVSRRRSMPNSRSASTKPKVLMRTPMEPIRLALST